MFVGCLSVLRFWYEISSLSLNILEYSSYSKRERYFISKTEDKQTDKQTDRVKYRVAPQLKSVTDTHTDTQTDSGVYRVAPQLKKWINGSEVELTDPKLDQQNKI